MTGSPMLARHVGGSVDNSMARQGSLCVARGHGPGDVLGVILSVMMPAARPLCRLAAGLGRRVVDDAVYVVVRDDPRTFGAHDHGPRLDELVTVVLDNEPPALRWRCPCTRLEVSQ